MKKTPLRLSARSLPAAVVAAQARKEALSVVLDVTTPSGPTQENSAAAEVVAVWAYPWTLALVPALNRSFPGSTNRLSRLGSYTVAIEATSAPRMNRDC